MLPIDFSIDLHCHPTYKTLGKSYNSNKGVQSSNKNHRSSLWFYDPPSVSDKLLNYAGSLSKFSQSNLTAAIYGKVWVMVLSMGCIEKWFFNNKMGTGLASDVAGNFAAGIGTLRISAIQNINDYYADLDMEYKFIEAMNNKAVRIDGSMYQYRIVHNFAALEKVMRENAIVLQSASHTAKQPITIAIIPAVEGMHVLNCGQSLSAPCKDAEVKKNAAQIKQHPNRPWFVTFAHHFYNELCGHAKSFSGFIASKCNQSKGLGDGFTSLGIEVLEILLDNTNNDRIFIDIKHMSARARREFILKRRANYPDIPIIISHGACNGLPSLESVRSNFPSLGETFNAGDINFYDDEIIEMVRSNGIMGLQLDERRIANKEKLRETKNSVFQNKIMHFRSKLLWNQIQYIAELLDHNNLPAWEHIAIGSDYDGIVDALNSFWTLEEFEYLKSYLERHAYDYLKGSANKIKNSFNKIEPALIVQNIFQNNAWVFFKRWF